MEWKGVSLYFKGISIGIVLTSLAMADPLSVTASVITVIGVVKTTVQTIEKLRVFRRAPNAFAELQNELSEICLQLSSLETIRDELESQSVSAHSLAALLRRIKSKLLETESYMSENLFKLDNKLQPRVRRLKWMSHHRKVVEFKDTIRALRQELIAAIASNNLAYSSRIHVQLQKLEVTNSNASVKVDEMVKNQKQIEEQQRNLVRKFADDPSGNAGANSTSHSEHDWNLVCHVMKQSRNCESSCPCVCHRKYNRQLLPGFLDRFIGSLFLEYSAFPIYKPACSHSLCVGSTSSFLTVRYQFPRHLINCVVRAYFRYSDNGPQYGLKVVAVVSPRSAVYNFALAGNLHGLIKIFNARQASPTDVDIVDGASPLHYAISRRNLDVCRFLINRGADPLFESKAGLSAADFAWQVAMTRATPEHVRQELKMIFPEPEYLVDGSMPRLHLSVLGKSCDRLEDILETNPDVNEVDAKKRSALFLAVMCGDHDAMKLLLRAGADPMLTRTGGFPPFSPAARSHDTTAMEILLENGARVNYQDFDGRTALMITAFLGHDPTFLICNGADTDLYDNHGRTALNLAADQNHGDVVTRLAHYGANIDVEDVWGVRPIHRVIERNATGSFQALIELKADLIKPTRRGECLISFVFDHATTSIIEILHRAAPHGLWDAAMAAGVAEELQQAALLLPKHDVDQTRARAFAILLELLRNIDGY